MESTRAMVRNEVHGKGVNELISYMNGCPSHLVHVDSTVRFAVHVAFHGNLDGNHVHAKRGGSKSSMMTKRDHRVLHGVGNLDGCVAGSGVHA